MKLIYWLAPYTKVNLKSIKDLKKSLETINLIDENIGKNLLDINMSNLFLNTSPQEREAKAKMNKWNYNKLKSFRTAKYTIIKTKRPPTVWENIFENSLSNTGLTSKAYKELTVLNTQKPNNPIKK